MNDTCKRHAKWFNTPGRVLNRAWNVGKRRLGSERKNSGLIWGNHSKFKDVDGRLHVHVILVYRYVERRRHVARSESRKTKNFKLCLNGEIFTYYMKETRNWTGFH